MAIFAPGVRDKHGKLKSNTNREILANLSLTAMVDMFTVLTIFLLQNYNSTGELIKIRNDVELPQATQIRELKPAHVIIISEEKILVDETEVADFNQVKAQKSWMINPLYKHVRSVFAKSEQEYREKLSKQINDVVDAAQERENKPKDFRKITLQADKNIDFLSIKKVMFTLTQAGAHEIHFAVITSNTEKYKVVKDEVEEEVF